MSSWELSQNGPNTKLQEMDKLITNPEIHWFIQQRARIVSALDGYRSNIWAHESKYYREIARSLETDARDIASLILVPERTTGLEVAYCTRERITKLLTSVNSLRDTIILDPECEPGEVMEVLFMISRNVGRIGVVGVSDPYADAMEQQARELQRMYGARRRWGYQDDEKHWLRRNWRALKVNDARCGCSCCRR